jgi:hypothetical protein
MEAGIVEDGIPPALAEMPSLIRVALRDIRSASRRGLVMRQYCEGREDRLPSALPQSKTKIDVAELDRISLCIETTDRIEFALLYGQAGSRDG